MKKFIIQFVLLTIVIFGALFIYRGQQFNNPFLPQQPKLGEVSVGEARIKVEIAETADKRSKGLGGRESLGTDSGMLFIFPREDMYSFWMKGLKFPLDFIWIKGDKVAFLTENVPVPGPDQKDKDLPIYQSKGPIDKFIEVNAGFVSTHNIKVGDTVTIK